MAPQDYVKRGQAKKRKPNKSTKKRVNKKKVQTPWFRIFIATTLVSGFVFGLYYLQANKGEQEAQADLSQNDSVVDEVLKTAKKETVNQNKGKDPLPVMKEEEWAFIDALPEYSVEVDVEELPDSDRQYIMQCGSFRLADQAEELRARIAMQNLESEVIESNGKNGRWFRVVLGPFDKKRVAEKQRHQLRRGKIQGCKIW